jgi:hypothetical protein
MITEAMRIKMSEATKKRNLYGERNPFFGKHHSLDSLKKMSEAKKGKLLSEKTRKKMSESRKGKNNPMFGKKRHLSEETRRKISEGNKGKILSEEARLNISKAKRGRGNPQYGKSGEKSPRFGKHHPEETREKLSQYRGEKASNWKGGVSFLPYCQKFNDEFKERVRAFFNYHCIECGTPQNGRKLNVHHANFNKMTCCDSTQPLFTPLCGSCHSATNSNREYWEQHFTEMIEGYYQGKCFFTKDEMMNYIGVI